MVSDRPQSQVIVRIQGVMMTPNRAMQRTRFGELASLRRPLMGDVGRRRNACV